MAAARHILATGDEMEATRLTFGADDSTDFHIHGHEQAGIILSGAFSLKLKDNERTLQSGDAYVVPARAEHAFHVIEPGIVVIFTSPDQTIEQENRNEHPRPYFSSYRRGCRC